MAGASIDGISSLAPELQQAYMRASQAERKPLASLETRKSNLQEKLNLMNEVVGKVDSVKEVLRPISNATVIRDFKVLSSDERAVGGAVDKSLAVPGKHSFEVSSLASPASAMSNCFPDRDQTRLGTGYIIFETKDGDTQEIFVDNDHATLDGVATTINDAGLGVRAGVIKDQNDPELPFRLMIVTSKSGVDQTVSYPEFYFVDGEEEFYIEVEKPASNARISYQGFDFELDSNEVKDIVPGLSLSLKGITEPGRPAYVTIEQDIQKTALKIRDMVDRLNQVFSFIQSQNKLDENSQTNKTLGGDYGIRLAESRLRSTITQTIEAGPTGQVHTAADLGIQFNREGILTLDEKKFEAALVADYDRVVHYLCGDGVATGLVTRLNKTLNSISGGNDTLLSHQKRNQTDNIRRIDADIKQKESRIKDKEEALRLQLSRANAALEAIKTQGAAFGGLSESSFGK